VPADHEDWPQGWRPPFRTVVEGSGFFVLAETAAGRRVWLRDLRPAIASFEERIADWLDAKTAVLPESELTWPVSFVYVVVSPRLKPDGTIHVTEFGRGAAPAAPVDWLVRPSRSIVLAAVQALRSQRPAIQED
jgi:hypothetical protein